MSTADDAFTFTAPLWRWAARRETDDPSSWIFLSVPPDIGEELRLRAGEPRGFGSVPVVVESATSRWRTSIFPDAEQGGFVLPVKRAVRVAEGVGEGDPLTVTLHVRTS